MLRVTDLVKNFGELRALDHVSFGVGGGEILGFVGANGAGKSTAMRIIMGVLAADSGTVEIDGVEVVGQEVIKERAFAARQTVGYMPSERGFYPDLEVAEQLYFFARLKGAGREEAQRQVDGLLAEMGVGEYAHQPLSSLSTGNAQRVQLIASLVGTPQTLILDEPFSGLDPLAVEVMSSMLKNYALNGTTVLFSSHQLELIDQLSDKIAIIQSGKIVQFGTPDELRRAAGAPLKMEVPTPLNLIFSHLVRDVEAADDEVTDGAGMGGESIKETIQTK
jgi:ABC-2 type transport system ATP-binding protein